MSFEIWHEDGGRGVPMEEMFEPVWNREWPSVKPSGGGMWTAPPSETGGSAWTDWCLGEEFRGPEFHLYELHFNTERVYTIDTYDDLAALIRDYGVTRRYEGHPEYDQRFPDFERIAKDFDALRLTDEGQWQTRHSTPYDLYGWDCACTLWFRWCFTDVVDRGIWTPTPERVDG